MIRRPPRSTQGVSSAASDVYKRQVSTQSTWGIKEMKKGSSKFEDKMFEKYTSGDTLTGEELPKLAEDLELDIANDPEMLIFLFYCGSQNYGEITRKEFEEGLKKLGVSNESAWKGIKGKLTDVATGKNEAVFKEFHLFVFKYHMFKPGQKTLDIETGTTLIKIVLSKKLPEIIPKFLKFIEESGKKTISRDQWENLIDVLPIFEKGSDYDMGYAYPVIFDEFNLWLKKSKSTQLFTLTGTCLLYTSPSPRDLSTSRMPSSA
eukprot:TRINITY_DN4422_c0_g1_i2.p1 TRINITY_DN4422_c0_g1~~TRINITY_DN4422_c0_g1_i2.p1  ORF type:complete len:262 (+),score=72.37 TRINITY_DN4422_c0_g1_i2:93-878(+)